jgi:hypothetical protein
MMFNLASFAAKMETAEPMEDFTLNMRPPYFYPTSTQIRLKGLKS